MVKARSGVDRRTSYRSGIPERNAGRIVVPLKSQKDQAKAAFHMGVTFVDLAMRAMEQIQITPNSVAAPIIPGMVNAAFGAELFLKATLLLEGSAARGHELKKLFKSLSVESQAAVISDATAFAHQPESNFRAELTKHSGLFVDLRYHWEKQPAFHYSIVFMFALNEAALKRYLVVAGVISPDPAITRILNELASRSPLPGEAQMSKARLKAIMKDLES